MTPVAGALLLADSDAGKGSPVGLLIVLVLVVAVYFLYRSMNRHLRKVPGKFDRRASEQPPDDRRRTDPPADRPRDQNDPSQG